MEYSVKTSTAERLAATLRYLLDAGRWFEAEELIISRSEQEEPAIRLIWCDLLFERDEHGRLIRELTRLYEQASKDGSRKMLARLSSRFANLYRELGDFDLAQRYQRQVLTWKDDCEASDLLDLAQEALQSSRTELAESLTTSAMEMARNKHDLFADCLSVLGLAAGIAGDLRLSIRRFISALRMHRHLDLPREEGHDWCNLAEIFVNQNRLEMAISSLHRAQSCYQVSGAERCLSKVEYRLRQIHMLQRLCTTEPGIN